MTTAWLPIVPPLAVFILGFWTKRIQLSLFSGILLSAFIAAKGMPYETASIVFNSLWGNLQIEKLLSWSTVGEASNLFILVFVLTLGVIVEMIRYSNAVDAFVHFSEGRIRNKKGAETAALLLSHGLCIDDYLSSLSVGSVMKPLADRFGIARAKLAYLTDSMSGPLVILAPISSWAAAIITFLIDNGVHAELSANTLLHANPYQVYLSILPYIFYSVAVVATCWVIVRFGLSFGSMRHAERKAMHPAEPPPAAVSESCSRLVDFLLPMGLLLASTFVFLLYFGGWIERGSLLLALQQAPISLVLFFAGLTTLAGTTGYYHYRGLLTGATGLVFMRGIRLMFPVCFILLFAWTLGNILREELLVGQWLASLLSGSIPLNLIPLILFWNASLISLALGSSWATAAILIPIALPMVMAMGGVAAPATPEQLPILFPVLGAILSGAVCGNHISMVSDTTAMAATSSGCDHMDHVRTQVAYAIPIFIGSSAAFFAVGYLTDNVIVCGAIAVVVSSLCMGVAHWVSNRLPIEAASEQ